MGGGSAASTNTVALATPATRSGVNNSKKFAAALLGLFSAVTCHSQPNFCRACLLVPTNLHLQEWSSICSTVEDDLTLVFLTFGFPTGYEGPVPTPTFSNHASAVKHHHDVAAYITKELGEGAMLDPFDNSPFFPWTQTNPLLTRPNKDSHNR